MPKPFRLTPPKPFIPLEIEEQTALFEWARWSKLDGIDMLYATLNGVRLPIGLAVKMSQAGLKRGPLDINLDVARHGFHGLRGEMKRTKGGGLTEDQKSWIIRLQEEGYKAEVWRGSKEAIAAITEYLGGKHERRTD